VTTTSASLENLLTFLQRLMKNFLRSFVKKKIFIKNIFLTIGRRQDFTGWGGPSPADPAKISA
jgi:hypothetical protein